MNLDIAANRGRLVARKLPFEPTSRSNQAPDGNTIATRYHSWTSIESMLSKAPNQLQVTKEEARYRMQNDIFLITATSIEIKGRARIY